MWFVSVLRWHLLSTSAVGVVVVLEATLFWNVVDVGLLPTLQDVVVVDTLCQLFRIVLLLTPSVNSSRYFCCWHTLSTLHDNVVIIVVDTFCQLYWMLLTLCQLFRMMLLTLSVNSCSWCCCWRLLSTLVVLLSHWQPKMVLLHLLQHCCCSRPTDSSKWCCTCCMLLLHWKQLSSDVVGNVVVALEATLFCCCW